MLDVFDGEGNTRSHGELAVTYLPTIYKKIKLQTHENVGWGNIHLPEDTFHTTGYWFCVPNVGRGHVTSGTNWSRACSGLAYASVRWHHFF